MASAFFYTPPRHTSSFQQSLSAFGEQALNPEGIAEEVHPMTVQTRLDYLHKLESIAFHPQRDLLPVYLPLRPYKQIDRKQFQNAQYLQSYCEAVLEYILSTGTPYRGLTLENLKMFIAITHARANFVISDRRGNIPLRLEDLDQYKGKHFMLRRNLKDPRKVDIIVHDEGEWHNAIINNEVPHLQGTPPLLHAIRQALRALDLSEDLYLQQLSYLGINEVIINTDAGLDVPEETFVHDHHTNISINPRLLEPGYEEVLVGAMIKALINTVTRVPRHEIKEVSTLHRLFPAWVRISGVEGVRRALQILGTGGQPLLLMFEEIVELSRAESVDDRPQRVTMPEQSLHTYQSDRLLDWFLQDFLQPYVDRVTTSLTITLLEELEDFSPGMTTNANERDVRDMMPVAAGGSEASENRPNNIDGQVLRAQSSATEPRSSLELAAAIEETGARRPHLESIRQSMMRLQVRGLVNITKTTGLSDRYTLTPKAQEKYDQIAPLYVHGGFFRVSVAQRDEQDQGLVALGFPKVSGVERTSSEASDENTGEVAALKTAPAPEAEAEPAPEQPVMIDRLIRAQEEVAAASVEIKGTLQTLGKARVLKIKIEAEITAQTRELLSLANRIAHFARRIPKLERREAEASVTSQRKLALGYQRLIRRTRDYRDELQVEWNELSSERKRSKLGLLDLQAKIAALEETAQASRDKASSARHRAAQLDPQLQATETAAFSQPIADVLAGKRGIKRRRSLLHYRSVVQRMIKEGKPLTVASISAEAGYSHSALAVFLGDYENDRANAIPYIDFLAWSFEPDPETVAAAEAAMLPDGTPEKPLNMTQADRAVAGRITLLHEIRGDDVVIKQQVDELLGHNPVAAQSLLHLIQTSAHSLLPENPTSRLSQFLMILNHVEGNAIAASGNKGSLAALFSNANTPRKLSAAQKRLAELFYEAIPLYLPDAGVLNPLPEQPLDVTLNVPPEPTHSARRRAVEALFDAMFAPAKDAVPSAPESTLTEVPEKPHAALRDKFLHAMEQLEVAENQLLKGKRAIRQGQLMEAETLLNQASVAAREAASAYFDIFEAADTNEKPSTAAYLADRFTAAEQVANSITIRRQVVVLLQAFTPLEGVMDEAAQTAVQEAREKAQNGGALSPDDIEWLEVVLAATQEKAPRPPSEVLTVHELLQQINHVVDSLAPGLPVKLDEAHFHIYLRSSIFLGALSSEEADLLQAIATSSIDPTVRLIYSFAYAVRHHLKIQAAVLRMFPEVGRHMPFVEAPLRDPKLDAELQRYRQALVSIGLDPDRPEPYTKREIKRQFSERITAEQRHSVLTDYTYLLGVPTSVKHANHAKNKGDGPAVAQSILGTALAVLAVGFAWSHSSFTQNVALPMNIGVTAEMVVIGALLWGLHYNILRRFQQTRRQERFEEAA